MAITELVFPTSGTPTVPTDYAYQNGYLAQNAKGYNAVSLTNWDATTTAPQVASGSAIEINGATWQVDADTTILTTAATSGVNYLVFDDDAEAFGWNDTAPTWSATLNGWYVSGDRFTGHLCTWDGSTSYTVKAKYYTEDQQGDQLPIGSSIWTGSDSTQAVSAGGSSLLSAGAYFISSDDSAAWVEIDINSTWRRNGNVSALNVAFVVSDGSNARLFNNDSTTSNYYIKKIW